MKRLLTSAVMFLCCVATTFAQFSGSGAGTENDPYLITNPIQLNQLRNYLNTDNVYFKLDADIDLTEFLEDESPSQGWQPVGNSSSAAFKGILDGNGKTISGLWINRGTTNNVGLFGYTSYATIKNLTVIATTIVGKDNVGGISGFCDNSTFSGITFSGQLQGSSNVGGLIGNSSWNLMLSENRLNVIICASGDCVGGIIGKDDSQLKLTISNCYVGGNSKISGKDKVGGACGSIVGSHYTTNVLSSCFIYADVAGNNYIGGICGFSESSGHTVNMDNCGYIGNVNGAFYVGGLTGYIRKSLYNNIDSHNSCYAIGSVIATGDYAGGLVGYDVGYSYAYYNNVTNCYFSGSVSGKNYTAGLVGYKQCGNVAKSYSMASVVGAKYVGGLVGFTTSSTTIKTSVAINTRVTATEGEVARIVGHNEGSISAVGSTEENKSYNRTIVINQGVASDITDDLLNGTGVSKTTLKLRATYVAMDWDFTDTWAIQETECYPYFKPQTAPPVITSQLVSGATVISGKCVDGGTVTLEVDGVTQQMVSTGNTFSFTVSPLQAGHDVRLSARADGKKPSYYAIETVSYLGKGTEADPYQVYTASDLTGVYRKGYFKLMNDIDLTDYIDQFSPTEGWQSIGRDGSETIHFDGNGHKITGLWCNSTRDNTGLFSCFANGTIKNLTVEVASGKQVKGGANTGILIGKIINGTIENCKVSGTVADGTPVGGMVGLFDGGSISLCQSNVTISTTGTTSYVGGLVGKITGGTIDLCITQGTLKATGATSYVGGMIGWNCATVTNCYSTAMVSSSYNAAGLIAYNYGLVEKCYAIGNISSNNFGAGVVGYNDGENAVVRYCAAMNNIIDVTYESQQVQQGGGYGMRVIGGYKNGAPTPEQNNYALKTMQVSLNDVPQKVYDDIMNGTAKTDAELKQKAIYQTIGWDFDNIWNIDEGTSYPYQTIKVDTGTDPNDPNDPNLSDPTANTLALSNLSGFKGKQVVLPIALTNQHDITGLQFDLYLPTGITVATKSNSKMMIETTERMEGSYTISSNQIGDYVRIVGYSADGDAFTGNSGDILKVTLNIGENVADGDYGISIKDIVLSDVNNTEYHPADAAGTLTVKSYMLGDVDDSGAVNINDVVCIINHILNKQVTTFIAEAADVDGSGTININDVVTLINRFILMKNNAPALTGSEIIHESSIADNYLHLADMEIAPGETREVQLLMTNANTVAGIQGNITLPAGLSFVTTSDGHVDVKSLYGCAEGFTLSCALQADGSLSFAQYSASGNTYSGTGGVFTFKVKASEDAAAGTYPVALSDVVMSVEGVGYDIPERTSMLMVSGTTGVTAIDNGELTIDNYYTLDGIRHEGKPTQKGVYIVNGKTIIIK